MKCCICNKGPAEGVTIYRINAKGIHGIWACEKHLNQTDAPPISPEVRIVVDALEGK
jgi:hypothetical protein